MLKKIVVLSFLLLVGAVQYESIEVTVSNYSDYGVEVTAYWSPDVGMRFGTDNRVPADSTVTMTYIYRPTEFWLEFLREDGVVFESSHRVLNPGQEVEYVINN